ncbi:MAG: hypothetical protein LBS77_02495 [Desulfovibrio sp.]|nr:hypothetical protein [Desulfovibrio sp.]
METLGGRRHCRQGYLPGSWEHLRHTASGSPGTAGIEAPDVRRMREFEDENDKPEQLVYV